MSKINKKESGLPVIAIVGRPNVGKSSIFNAIVGRRLSIVHEMSGVTRDRVSVPASYRGRRFQLIDTGGLGAVKGERRDGDMWDGFIRDQAAAAIEEADVLICVGNVQDGVTALDEEAARYLRQSGKKVIYAANKADNKQLELESAEFSRLGFSPLIPVSCLHNYRVSDLIEAALAALPPEKQPEPAGEEKGEKPFSIAVVGRPNVGKSSLVNALLGEDRVIVSDIAGTTRDAVDSDFFIRTGEELTPAVLVDTAGLRRRGKVDNVVEYFSSMRSESAIRRADLVIFVVEASGDGVTAQDKKIASIIASEGRAAVIAANKFDLLKGESGKNALLKELRRSLPGMDYAPAVFISALEKSGLRELLDMIVEVRSQWDNSVSTGLVNRVLSDAFTRATPPVVGNAPLKLYYASMTGNRPPTFLLFVNRPEYCAPNYLAYLKKVLRDAFDFTGFPIRIDLRARPKKVESFHSAERSGRRGGRKKSGSAEG